MGMRIITVSVLSLAVLAGLSVGRAAYSAKQDGPAKPAYLLPSNPVESLNSGANRDLIRCFESIQHFSQATAAGGAALADGVVFIPGLRAQTRGLYAFTGSEARYYPFADDGFHYAEIETPGGHVHYVGFSETAPDEYQLTVRDTLLPENQGRVKKVVGIPTMDLEARTTFRRLLRMAVQKSYASFDSRLRLTRADPKFADAPNPKDYLKALKKCEKADDLLVRDAVKAEISKFSTVAASP